jgi:hypothetical protein
MFIPNYQIHNILKDFTHQLRNEKHRQEAGARLESVVNKVADSIMDRVTRLGEEEVRCQDAAPAGRSVQSAASTSARPSGTFRYHVLVEGEQKTEQRLAVENPEQLIRRFQSVINETDSDPS